MTPLQNQSVREAKDIPQDIFQTACGIVMEAKSLKSMLRHKDVVDAIASALQARDERAAKIAAAYPYHSPFYARTPSLDAKIRDGQTVASYDIAAAIRNQGDQP